MTAAAICTIVSVPEWRHPMWDDDLPSRPGYSVTCSVCGQITDPGWMYADRGRAQGVATRHERKHQKRR